MLGQRRILGILSREEERKFYYVVVGVCDKLVLEHGYNTWPAWAHERVAQKLCSKHS